MPLPRSQTVRGFSLVEVLTVIAIVGILAAIVIPLIGKMRDSARLSEQTTNLRQIGQGLALYLADNRQVLPRRVNNRMVRPDGGVSFQASWMELVNDYLVERASLNGIYLHRENPVWRSPFAETLGNYSQHYGVNVFITDGTSAPSTADPFPAPHESRRMATVHSPARSVYVGEINSGGFGFDPRVEYSTERDANTNFRATLPGTRTMLLFLDFHVETLEASEATFDANQRRYRWAD